MLLNFGILAVVKYTDFVLAASTACSPPPAQGRSCPLANLVLPMGISFYTFQSMGYLIDVYWASTPRSAAWDGSPSSSPSSPS